MAFREFQPLPDLKLIAKTDYCEPVGKILGFSQVGRNLNSDFKLEKVK
jgi:hypothetical protein